MTTPASSRNPDPRPRRVLEIFLAARALPVDRSEAFVRQQAGADTSLAEEVLALLRGADAAGSSKVFAAGQAAMANLADDLEAENDDFGPPTEAVQSTATGELLRRLAEAPKLDTRRYELQGEVGKGAMGVVLRIFDRHLHRRLAMKVMQHHHKRGAEAQGRLGHFLEEAQVTSQLDHPGVVPVHELGLDENGKVYFTMRLVKGRTAAEIFELARAQKEEWTTTRALEVILKVCDTMAYAHARGVLHRDLKPSNVMVGKFGEVYVMDWGLAKVLGSGGAEEGGEAVDEEVQVETVRRSDAEHDRDGPMASVAGQVKGTKEYMPPEQLRGESLDRRADVYSIGAMLYELLAGRPPYTRAEIERGALAGPPQRVEAVHPGVPAELAAIVERAMQRDREQRYGGVLELAADLRAFLDLRSVKAYRTGALVELQLWVRRNRSLAASLAAAVLILVAGIAAAWTFAKQAEEKQRVAAQKAREFDQLSGMVMYERAVANEECLYPAWPEKAEAMERWLREDAGDLLEMRSDIERTIRNLEELALPPTPEEQESDRRQHPRFVDLQALTDRVASLRHAKRLRAGADLTVPDLNQTERDLDANTLNNLAMARVAPNPTQRLVYGEEPLGLAYARLATKKAEGKSGSHYVKLTLALALAANGQDDSALDACEEAWEMAPDDQKDKYSTYIRAIRSEIAYAPDTLAAAEMQLTQLEVILNQRRTWRFGDTPEEQARSFLHKALLGVSEQIERLEQRVTRVRGRLNWASSIQELSLHHPNARRTWQEVRESLANHELYARVHIEMRDRDILDLVPIGQNPETGLWEFYHLPSAWDGKCDPSQIEIPDHGPGGSIKVTNGTGIVFVLVPGGRVLVGAQALSEDRPNFDPAAAHDETLQEVRLGPFFIARHELTQGQWMRLCDSERDHGQPSRFPAGANEGDVEITLANPVENVSWDACHKQMQRYGLVLPTEAQWEYSCRAGTSTPWSCLPDTLRLHANLRDSTRSKLVQVDQPEPWSDGHAVHAPVGSFLPNSIGLYDTHGNVSEWCGDNYVVYGSMRDGDGRRRATSSMHCCRGGHFDSRSDAARSAARIGSLASSFSAAAIGLRPARLLRP
ncbi:MAG: SUMF1/EgtB/PvdO family nonheme iron enzyme [Planctomycetes bacterium]|nr:SUMF1/EgtB/PvdO family nonheme iron enzyme [Planctomycetota bacterium]